MPQTTQNPGTKPERRKYIRPIALLFTILFFTQFPVSAIVDKNGLVTEDAPFEQKLEYNIAVDADTPANQIDTIKSSIEHKAKERLTYDKKTQKLTDSLQLQLQNSLKNNNKDDWKHIKSSKDTTTKTKSDTFAHTQTITKNEILEEKTQNELADGIVQNSVETTNNDEPENNPIVDVKDTWWDYLSNHKLEIALIIIAILLILIGIICYIFYNSYQNQQQERDRIQQDRDRTREQAQQAQQERDRIQQELDRTREQAQQAQQERDRIQQELDRIQQEKQEQLQKMDQRQKQEQIEHQKKLDEDRQKTLQKIDRNDQNRKDTQELLKQEHIQEQEQELKRLEEIPAELNKESAKLDQLERQLHETHSTTRTTEWSIQNENKQIDKLHQDIIDYNKAKDKDTAQLIAEKLKIQENLQKHDHSKTQLDDQKRKFQALPQRTGAEKQIAQHQLKALNKYYAKLETDRTADLAKISKLEERIGNSEKLKKAFARDQQKEITKHEKAIKEFTEKFSQMQEKCIELEQTVNKQTQLIEELNKEYIELKQKYQK